MRQVKSVNTWLRADDCRNCFLMFFSFVFQDVGCVVSAKDLRMWSDWGTEQNQRHTVSLLPFHSHNWKPPQHEPNGAQTLLQIYSRKKALKCHQSSLASLETSLHAVHKNKTTKTTETLTLFPGWQKIYEGSMHKCEQDLTHAKWPGGNETESRADFTRVPEFPRSTVPAFMHADVIPGPKRETFAEPPSSGTLRKVIKKPTTAVFWRPIAANYQAHVNWNRFSTWVARTACHPEMTYLQLLV